MRVVIEGLGEDRALRTLVNGKVAASLGRLHVPATTARVQFANETSAKGGPAARCSITVDLPRRPELHADITAESFRLAFEQAFAMLERQVERDRARRREDRRLASAAPAFRNGAASARSGIDTEKSPSRHDRAL